MMERRNPGQKFLITTACQVFGHSLVNASLVFNFNEFARQHDGQLSRVIRSRKRDIKWATILDRVPARYVRVADDDRSEFRCNVSLILIFLCGTYKSALYQVRVRKQLGISSAYDP
jgi:hypothetical protein